MNKKIGSQARCFMNWFKKSRFFIRWSIFCLMSSITNSYGQDSLQVLSLNDFFVQIMAHHPVVKQVNLLSEGARQEIRLASAFFDPVLSSKYYNKSFKGNNYFDLWDTYLQVPVWFGVDFKAGYERNSGPNINPEDYTPPSGLTSLGISVPLGQGLIIDERRSTLRQARLLQDLAEAEKIKTINKILLQASKDYWDWQYNYQKWQLNLQGYELASFRLRAVKERVTHGDLASIDSVEAKVQVQNFEVLAEQSRLEFRNSSLVVSNYLWKDDLVPVELTSVVIPSKSGSEITSISKDSVERIADLASERHPELIKINTKINQLEIERAYLKDKFKPKLNVEYNILQQGFGIKGENVNRNYINNNYKLGISFSQSLFMRQERGKLQLNKLKVSDAQYSYAQTNREIKNSITSAYNEWLALENQIRSQEESVNNYEILRSAEQQRFEGGESSLFLINQRDVSLINSRMKLYELQAKYAKNKVFLQWAAGNVQLPLFITD